MRKKTSRARHHRHQVKVLKSEVMSPRIAWFNFLESLRFLVKIAIIGGVLFGIGYGIREAVEHTFHENPDFRLQAITLNENDVFDESSLVAELNIDLTANIFDFDVDRMREEILRNPAIQSAKVERELPGNLVFKITTRTPVAWIACETEGFSTTRAVGGLLVDHSGFTFPCPELQLQESNGLPVFQLSSDPEHPVNIAETLEHPELRNCMRLLKAFRSAYPEDVSMIGTIRQETDWSLNLTTRAGTVATFGLGNHDRQLDYLGRALRHASRKGYTIETINLIPKRNVPITVAEDSLPPRAIPVFETPPEAEQPSRQEKDLHSLLNRN